MNSTELYIAAGEAICKWGKTHKEGCVLSLASETVLCDPIVPGVRIYRNPLAISTLEVLRGMKQHRWDEIGTELHNLYCKELACQAHQKH